MEKLFVWTDEYSVQVAEIDEQHRHFLDICNGLVELSRMADFTSEEAFSRVAKMGDYAFYHLAFEEELFVKTNYPDGPMHTEIHNKFREKAKKIIQQAREGSLDPDSLKEIADFSVNWLLSHILHTDKKYSDYFNEHGIK